MPLSLRTLADLEAQLYQRVMAFEGTIEARAQQLAGSGIEAAYQQVHRDYWQLASTAPEAAVRLEALKRLLFLNFCAVAEPGIYTGVDVDPVVMQQSFALLEAYVAGQQADAELRWMLASYAPWLGMLPAFSPGLPATEAFIAALDPAKLHQPDRQLPPHTMDHRGQLGIYWRSREVERPAA